MIILKDNFNGNTTYIVGEYVQNGCQTFHISQIDKVCKNFNVPSSLKQEVVEYYEGLDVQLSLQESLISDIVEVRALVAKQGYGLEILAKDKYTLVRLEVVKQGYNLEEFSNDKHYVIRREVAKQGVCLDKLLLDNDWIVRVEAELYPLHKETKKHMLNMNLINGGKNYEV